MAYRPFKAEPKHGMTYSKSVLVHEAQKIIDTRMRGYPFTRPLRSFRVKDLKAFINLYEKKGGK